MAKTPIKLPPAHEIALFDRSLAAATPAIERNGATNPYTSLNGQMSLCR
jgi:hypothetical protein